MDAQPAPVQAPPVPSKSQLKFQICQAVHRLIAGNVPGAWQEWDAQRTSEFLEHVQGCHTGRSLAGLVVSARHVAEAYTGNPHADAVHREILNAEAAR